jgi:hypothetical protein
MLGQQGHTAGAGFVLEDGTPVKVRISQTVSSADAQVNDRVALLVALAIVSLVQANGYIRI